jgi:Actinobacteria/chloroflexi VLRF1 release factor
MTGGSEPAGRLVEVSAERLAGWLDRFAERHGDLCFDHRQGVVQISAPDGATASVRLPLGPLEDHPDLRMALLDHVRRDRRVGALLVRRGGYAVGVFEGARLLTSKVGRAYVQGRTKAGGWSQQRYARRREQQAGQAYAEAADAAVRVLLPVVGDLEAVVGGGDAIGVDAVLADPRLGPIRRLRSGRVLPTPDPRLDVLRQFGDQLRAVSITLNQLA